MDHGRHGWQANLRVLNIEELKSTPHVPTPNPFFERLIVSVRRELLDQILFWNARDLQNKLNDYQLYFNEQRCHLGISSATPVEKSEEQLSNVISLDNY